MKLTLDSSLGSFLSFVQSFIPENSICILRTKKTHMLRLIIGLFCVVVACQKPVDKLDLSFEITELSDDAYPDNPDIGFRSLNYVFDFFDNGELVPSDSLYDFYFKLKGNDSLLISGLNLTNWIPAVPRHLKADPYLSSLALVNQEWNRNQIAFYKGQFTSSNAKIARVDLARNCLNAYLWEVILYEKAGSNFLPFAHGWFDLPKSVYDSTFEHNNSIPMDSMRYCLEDWENPPSKKVEASLLRTVTANLSIQYQDWSDKMYPLEGARKKKRKEIIYPESFSTMRDLQTDSTLFATFSQPGFYNRKDPRKTELGRFRKLVDVAVNKIASPVSVTSLLELNLLFEDGKRSTSLVIGGVNPADFPVLAVEDANNGWKNSMGFGNHTFYQTIEEHRATSTVTSPYYAYLADKEGNWLDSHHVGIDGPIFHWDSKNPNVLHLWLLSFERHALVGHYTIELLSNSIRK